MRSHPIVLSAVSVCAAVLLLTGCASGAADFAVVTPTLDETAQESDQAQDAPTNGSVTLVMAGQSFTFATTTCMISDEDVLVSGPGADDESGEPAYLDIDFVNMDSGDKSGEARIDLGVDVPFSSSDDFFATRISPDEEYMFLYEQNGMVVESNYWAASGTPIGPATLTISCD